ncbi:hypothetical protein [Pseudomonas mosselii]|uniref:hypothetical protein n=1 Tax=Pseudomonas mosselii TaxID=78327 RepID=UPI00164953F7|nr:hypothetical protein [Pseudomonas mosselii]MBC3458863.1 hypothetical protein [Pseudomonas mosselii]
MTNAFLETPTEQLNRTYIYPISLYFISVSVLYLWGYWSPFDINILEYLSLTDIVKSTAYPIASAFLSMAAGIIVSGLTGNPPNPGSRSKTPVGKFFNRNLKAITIIYVIVTLSLFNTLPTKYSTIIVPALLGIPLAIYADNLNLLAGAITHYRLRGACTYMLAVLPFFAFGQGYWKAQQIINGDKFDYVISTTRGLQALGIDEPTRNPRLVGHAGDHIFLWDPQNSLLAISKIEEGKPLILRRYQANKSFPINQ